VNELVGEVEDKNGGVLDRILKRGIGVQVGGQANPWKVLDILVRTVNHLSQFLSTLEPRAVVRGVLGDLDILLKHPHFHLLLKDVPVGGRIFSDDLGDGGAPIRN